MLFNCLFALGQDFPITHPWSILKASSLQSQVGESFGDFYWNLGATVREVRPGASWYESFAIRQGPLRPWQIWVSRLILFVLLRGHIFTRGCKLKMHMHGTCKIFLLISTVSYFSRPLKTRCFNKLSCKKIWFVPSNDLMQTSWHPLYILLYRIKVYMHGTCVFKSCYFLLWVQKRPEVWISKFPFINFHPRMQQQIDAQIRSTTSACLIRTLHHASPQKCFCPSWRACTSGLAKVQQGHYDWSSSEESCL